MTRYRIKIVPDAEPNANGEWKDITDDLHGRLLLMTHEEQRKWNSNWQNTVTFLQRFVPAGFHIVQTEFTR